MYEIVVATDENDCNYLTATNQISQEGIEHFEPLFEAIRALPPTGRWDGGKLWPATRRTRRDTKLSDVFDANILPLAEEFQECYMRLGDNGIHTICSIVYYPIPEKTVIL